MFPYVHISDLYLKNVHICDQVRNKLDGKLLNWTHIDYGGNDLCDDQNKKVIGSRDVVFK